MSDAIIVALITGGLALLGTVITVRAGNQKISGELHEHNAVQDERIKNLTEEVRKHNSFAERIPTLEARFDSIEKRIEALERK